MTRAVLRRPVTSAALVLSLTLAGTSCGDDSSDADASPASAEPTTTTEPTVPAGPTATSFRAAVEDGDVDALQSVFADDIELFTPVLDEPFSGRAQVDALFAVLVDVFEDVDVQHELTAQDTVVLHFEARVGDQPIEIVDVLDLDEEGRIRTFTVTSRPAAATEELAAAVAPHLEDIEAAE